MKRIAIVLFTSAFTLACLTLCLLLWLFQNIYVLKIHIVKQLPLLTEIVFKSKWLLLLVPFPFLLYLIVTTYRKPVNADRADVFIAVMAFVLAAVACAVSFAALLPCLPYNE
jgi:hypothetical protein